MTSLFSIGGIASGLDTATIVQQLMQLERLPLVQYQKHSTALRRVDDAWGGVVTKLSALRASIDKVATPAAFGKQVSTTSSDEEVATAKATGAPTPGSVSFTVLQLAAAQRGVFAGTFADADASLPAGSFTLTQGERSVTVTDLEGKSLRAVAAEVNAALPGASAQVVGVDGGYRLYLSAKATGTAEQITLTDVTGAAGFESLTTLQAAADARIDLGDATTLTRGSNHITDLVQGVEIELRQAGAPATIEVRTDAAAQAQSVKGFVSSLNDLLTTLKKGVAYNSATNTAGALQGEGTARQLLLDLRDAISSPVEGLAGELTSAGALGISLTREGEVVLDEAKLGEALQRDPEGVVRLLTATTETVGAQGVVGAVGAVVSRTEGVSGTIAAAREAIKGRITANDRSIEAFDVRLEQREITLRRKFAGLELALSRLQSQGSGLLAQLGSLNGNGS